jgi:hypothetical protein
MNMNEVPLDSLIDLFNQSCPILPDTPENDVKKAIDQFSYPSIGSIQVICEPLKEWSQGDILDDLIFVEWSDNGEASTFSSPGMIITSTCDLDRKQNIVVCPCFSFSELSKQGSSGLIDEIAKNTVFEFFYIGKALGGDKWAVDLSHPMTLPRERVAKKIEAGDIVRKHSLTSKGWYLFVTKFSMKYFRPDDPETMRLR